MAITAKEPKSTPSSADIPPLEPGDRLSRGEFEHRYEAMPHLKKAELIEGIVCMPSPVSKKHGKPHGDIGTWLGHYEAYTPGVERFCDTTDRMDEDNEPQPDVLLRILPDCGGQTRDTERDDYIEAQPELTAEIASSSASYDLHAKKNAYRRNGVREYIVVLVRERRVIWWRLVAGDYVEVEPEDGVLKSRVFPGLWLDPETLIHGDMKGVLDVSLRGIASPEHSAFREKLARTRAGNLGAD